VRIEDPVPAAVGWPVEAVEPPAEQFASALDRRREVEDDDAVGAVLGDPVCERGGGRPGLAHVRRADGEVAPGRDGERVDAAE
jgi:hypothetical protein